jgi:ribosomal-protein-alanine N-acetyltransferase
LRVAARFAPLRLLGVETGRPRWPTLTLTGDGLLLRPPDIDDFQAWATLREASRAFLTPWEPRWPEDDLTRASFRRRIKRYHQEIDRDEAYPFLIFREVDGTLLGGLTLGNVRRGAAQTVTLGYWMGEPHAGQHVMSRAVGLACRHAFQALGLARIEAACLPENAPSIRLLENAGFQKEGYARSYLNIDGQRRDHLLFALLAGDRAASVHDPRRR